jgi:hypothetical protein
VLWVLGVMCGVDIAVCYIDILYIVQCVVGTGGYVWCGYNGVLCAVWTERFVILIRTYLYLRY